jgi:hypothetical protein
VEVNIERILLGGNGDMVSEFLDMLNESGSATPKLIPPKPDLLGV